jgi:hypothetical protein
MLRRTALVLAAILAVLGLPTGAAAGGAASFDFNRDYFVPGDRAVGDTLFWIAKEDRHLLDRTFYAYLIPEMRYIKPPKIPADAVPLGPITLDGLARVSFIVPDVSPGEYTVDICDSPCRHSHVGDLFNGSITVVESRQEARLRMVIDRLERDLRREDGRLMAQGRQADRRAKLLHEQITDLRATTEKWERRQAWLETRLAQLEREPTGLTFDRAGWAVAVLAIAALALSVWRRRRRSPAAAPGANGSDDAPNWQLEEAILEEEREPASVGRAGGEPG